MPQSCCWTPNTQIGPMSNPAPGDPTYGPTGVIALQAYPDCMEPYNYEHRADMAYLVGWTTEHEKVFRSDQSGAAIGYATSFGEPPLRIDRVLLTSLCAQAVWDLYGE